VCICVSCLIYMPFLFFFIYFFLTFIFRMYRDLILRGIGLPGWAGLNCLSGGLGTP
jgi:hypothetical protein